MAFDGVFGQERVKQIFISSFERNRLAHAYLFHGLSGVGKDAMSISIAMSLHCKGKIVGGCGQCTSCLCTQRLEHPCFYLILPVPTRPKAMNEKKYIEIIRDRAIQRMNNPYKEVTYGPELPTLPIIGIDQVRAMKQEVILKVSGGGHRVFLISQAEKMTLSAANSLLKLLEEPPQGTIIILTTALPSQLLDTIVSRCQIIRFDTLQEKTIESALAQKWHVPKDKAKLFAKMAGGSLLRALHFIEEGFEEKQQAAFEFIRDSLDHNILNRINGVDKLLEGRDKVELQWILQILLTFLRDLFHLQLGNQEMIVNLDHVKNLESIHANWPEFDAKAGMRYVEQAIDLIEKNVYLSLIVYSLSQKLHKMLAY